MQVAAGIQSRTLASYELAWSGGRDPLTSKDVLVIDEAGMIGTRQLARVLEVAQKAHAKVVLVGDPEQLQAIEAGAPFRGIAAQHGVAELTQVRRQREAWQREATADLAAGQTRQALAAYEKEGALVAVEEREAGEECTPRALGAGREAAAEGLAARARVHAGRCARAQQAVRTLRSRAGKLGKGQEIATEQGKKEFAVHDRIRFGRNEKTLGVKNGSLGHRRADRGRGAAGEIGRAFGFAGGGRYQVLQAPRSRLCGDRAQGAKARRLIGPMCSPPRTSIDTRPMWRSPGIGRRRRCFMRGRTLAAAAGP